MSDSAFKTNGDSSWAHRRRGYHEVARGLCMMVPSGEPACNKCAAIEAALLDAYARGTASSRLLAQMTEIDGKGHQ